VGFSDNRLNCLAIFVSALVSAGARMDILARSTGFITQSQLQKITLRVPTRRNILKHDVIPTVSLDEAVAREGVGSRSRERRE
jgi:hypothetical protein